jgi:hypothetical protein
VASNPLFLKSSRVVPDRAARLNGLRGPLRHGLSIPCQLPLSPMMVFAIRIEHALDVSI